MRGFERWRLRKMQEYRAIFQVFRKEVSLKGTIYAMVEKPQHDSRGVYTNRLK